ncbi:MAG: beta-N-acetylglucosaminidase domain-containing protein [Bacteroidales bacterium]|nr:beta-N-acetylglucosaminidase domain-containing protein [Bacteroidales bacterium]
MKFLRSYTLPLIIAVAVVCPACNKKPSSTQAAISWLSEDPLSIPYRIRQQKYEKGNLVRNSSFESGKNLIVDSTGVTYRIDGWQKIGDQVQWVNIETDSIYCIDEASDSIRSVKIQRTNANETDDPGEGVRSDFIRVIPGNYNLSFHIRLKNISPNRSRLGTRIFDAINIRLLFYDKNKIEITSEKYDPYRKIWIDNSFKGYAFSNYYEIDDFSWARVTGKSCNVPCVDGDIPDDARYVKIFLGLKGNGTMWIDQVDFRYSKENFSLLERMEKLMDTTLLKQQTVIPQPKRVKKLASIPYYGTGRLHDAVPLICIPVNSSVETRQAADLLKQKMEGLFQRIIREPAEVPDVRIVTKISEYDFNHTRLIFSIGSTNLFKRFREILPVNEISGREQGYFVYTTPDLSNIVFLYGNKPAGGYYAAASAVQLFDNKKFIFHNAQIIDYPDFPERNILMKASEIKNDIRKGVYQELILNKINGVYFNIDAAHMGNKQEDLTEIPGDFPDYNELLSRRFFLQVGELQTGLKNANNSRYLILPGLKKYLDMMDVSDKIVISPSYGPDPEISDITVSCRAIEKYADLVSEAVNLAAGKKIPDGVACIPVWRNNEEISSSNGKAEIYLSEMRNQLHDDIRYLWNGCTWNSYHTSNTDLVRIKSIMDSNPIWWDNSMMYDERLADSEKHPAKLNLFNLFMPFNNYEIRELLDNIDTTQIYISFYPQSELDIIRLYTVSDFLWNTNDYDPDFSLWKTLHLRYGSTCARELVLFADIYATLLRISVELKDPVYHQRFIRKAIPLQENLEEHLETIKNRLGNEHPLVKELQVKYDEVASKIPLQDAM